jgi:hypothetical protein
LLRIRIRDPVLFTPRIRDPGWSNGRIRIRDKQTKFVNMPLYKQRSDPGSGAFLPPGSGMEQWSDPDPGSGIKHPGSITLVHAHLHLQSTKGPQHRIITVGSDNVQYCSLEKL